MRYQFGDFGPHWARAVLIMGRLMSEHGDRAAVRDAIGWLAGICQQLQPFAILDSATRDLVVECLTWSRDFHAEDGSPDAAASLTSALQAMESFPTVGGSSPS
jgi:hypothetical protein